MDEISLAVLFVGGPLNGTRMEWSNPPAYHPHQLKEGMVPYSKCTLSFTIHGMDAVYAPVGMTQAAILETLKSIPIEWHQYAPNPS